MSYSATIANIIPNLSLSSRQTLVDLMPNISAQLKNELLTMKTMTENAQQELLVYLTTLPESKENAILNTIADFPLSSLVQNFTNIPVSYKSDIVNLLPLSSIVKQELLTTSELSNKLKSQFVNSIILLEESVRRKIKDIVNKILDFSFLVKSNFVTFIKNLLEIIQTRFNILAFDVEKFGKDTLIIIIASFVAMLTAIFTLLIMSMYIISIFWENHRHAAFLSVIFVYLAVAIGGIVVIIKTGKSMGSVFSNIR
jgi:uncharacterized membrane protein YqjE